MRRIPSAFVLTLSLMTLPLMTQPVRANDSVAGFGVGGLEFLRSDAIALRSEVLTVSPGQIRVEYVFVNQTEAPVTVQVAFPLPEAGRPDDLAYFNLPFRDSDNYVGFETLVDGQPVTLTPHHRVMLDGVDRSGFLESLGLSPVAAMDYWTFAEYRRSWTPEQRRALLEQRFLDAEGLPRWTLQTTFLREQTFAPQAEVRVSHSYTPVAAASLDSLLPGQAEPPWEGYSEHLATLRSRYCPEPEIEAQMQAQLRGETGLRGFSTFFSQEVDYILTTGANWRGPIGHFRLVVESPGSWDFVFLCLPGALREAQNRITFEATDFVPVQDISVYVATAQGEAIEAAGPRP